jgi:hypothetical protein
MATVAVAVNLLRLLTLRSPEGNCHVMLISPTLQFGAQAVIGCSIFSAAGAGAGFFFSATALGAAIGSVSFLVLWMLFKLGEFYNKRRYPLHHAIQDGNLPLVAQLISDGADVNARAHAGRTPLHEALAGGHDEIASLLIKKGANPNVKDRSGYTPREWSVEYQIRLAKFGTRRANKGGVVLHFDSTETVALLWRYSTRAVETGRGLCNLNIAPRVRGAMPHFR